MECLSKRRIPRHGRPTAARIHSLEAFKPAAIGVARADGCATILTRSPVLRRGTRGFHGGVAKTSPCFYKMASLIL